MANGGTPDNTYDQLMEVFNGGFEKIIHAPSPDFCSFNTARNVMRGWKDAGHTTVFMAGSFDLLTPNHTLGLAHARTIGAMTDLGVDYTSPDRYRVKVYNVAASSAVKLMVTLDTNEGIEKNKSRQKNKGGAPKPILDWETRAKVLAMQHMPLTDRNEGHRTVDFITRHGPNCCQACEEGACVNRDNALMAAKLEPEIVIVNAQSLHTVEAIKKHKKEGKLKNTLVATIHQGDEYFDPLLGEPVSTSAIIKRARS